MCAIERACGVARARAAVKRAAVPRSPFSHPCDGHAERAPNGASLRRGLYSTAKQVPETRPQTGKEPIAAVRLFEPRRVLATLACARHLLMRSKSAMKSLCQAWQPRRCEDVNAPPLTAGLIRHALASRARSFRSRRTLNSSARAETPIPMTLGPMALGPTTTGAVASFRPTHVSKADALGRQIVAIRDAATGAVRGSHCWLQEPAALPAGF